MGRHNCFGNAAREGAPHLKSQGALIQNRRIGREEVANLATCRVSEAEINWLPAAVGAGRKTVCTVDLCYGGQSDRLAPHDGAVKPCMQLIEERACLGWVSRYQPTIVQIRQSASISSSRRFGIGPTRQLGIENENR